MFALRFVWKNLDHFRPRFIFVIVCGLVNGTLVFTIPVLLAEFTRSDFSSTDFQRLISLLVGVIIISLGLEWMMRKFGEPLGHQFGNNLRLKYYRRIAVQPYPKLTETHSGYLLSLLNRVGDGMAPLVADAMYTVAVGASTLILFFWYVARASLSLAVFNLLLLASFVFLSFVLSKKMVAATDTQNRKKATLLESLADFMTNVLTVKKLGLFSFAQGRLATRADDTNRQSQQVYDLHANRWLALHAIFNTAFLVTIGVLLWRISQGLLAVSILILFVTAFTRTRAIIERLSEYFRTLLEMRTFVQALEERIAEPPTIPHDQQPSWRTLGMRQVTFQYPGTTKKISIPVFQIHRGEKVFVAGVSGEGKSTLLNLLSGFLKADTGEIVVDDQLRPATLTSLQRSVAFVSQEVELFNISIRENLALGRIIEDRELHRALAAVDLDEWVGRLQRGLNTIVGEKGVRLSAGQKQRLNLLRALLLDRQICFLDEPTSHLDETTEKKIIDYLAEQLKDKTAVIVSHRPVLRQICNRSYTMNAQTLIET